MVHMSGELDKQSAELTAVGYTIKSIDLSKAELSTIQGEANTIMTSDVSTGRVVSPGRIHFELVGNKIFVDSKEVQRLLSSFQPICRRYFGTRYPNIRLSTVQLVQSLPGSIDQCWHADNANKGLTFVIPLVDITKENGTTQLIAGTHEPTSYRNARIVNPLLISSELLIMDARLLHRGSRNTSAFARPILVFRYDDVRTPAPGSGYIGAMVRNAIGDALFRIFS
jgi:ectoine hydroxylase-related dioxygenase (phytanoyl-CoA dioxygenase family)